MSSKLLGHALLALCMMASAAHAQNAAVRLDMTPDEVISASPGSRLVSRGERLSGGQVRVIGRDQFGGLEVPTRYFFDDVGLSMIEFRLPGRSCTGAVRAMIQTYGEPVRVSDQIVMRLLIWHDQASGRRIRLVTSGNAVCTFYHERLELYRAIDLAAD